MDLGRYFSTRRKEHHSHSHSEQPGSHHRERLPLFASPINQDVLEALASSNSPDLEKLDSSGSSTTASTAATTLATSSRTSSGNPIIYKRHHEASTIELFYDLFFVANLAYFTAMHQHTDAPALINYLKLFTLLWFTWLSTTLFDVRFSIDSYFARLCIAVQFGVFTGFVFAGPVFDKYDKSDDAKSYRYFAIVMAVSRFVIALQYFVVLLQGWRVGVTRVPVGLSGMVHLGSAVAFLVTRFVVKESERVGTGELVVWFVFAIVEGLAVFFIAMIWRIVSFKYTHLVERCQLLTLIIIGEGIIGMVKSVACIFKGQANNNATELGTVVAAVLLLYLMWMLYFDQLSSDRFGTVRQQIWSLLHYPLHMAILLCVEGNTSLIVWNSAVQALKWIWSVSPPDYSDPAAGFATTDAYITHLNQTMYNVNARFKTKAWNTTYDWNRNLTAIQNYTDRYGFRSPQWNNRTGDLTAKIFNNAQVFIFQAHADTLAKISTVSSPSTTALRTLEAVFDVFNVTVLQFYIGAGAMLLLLSIMYWFNKLHKTKYEFGEMIHRVVIGFALIITGVGAVLVDKTTAGLKFKASHWIIPIVVIAFVIVLALDNILLHVSHFNARRSSHGHRRDNSWAGTTVNDSGEDTDTADLISKHASADSRMRTTSPRPDFPHTAYSPYLYPASAQSQPRDFATASVERGRGSADSRVTLTDERDISPGMSFRSLGVAVTPPMGRDIYDGGRGRQSRTGGYESLNVDDEYEGHPLGVRAGT